MFPLRRPVDECCTVAQELFMSITRNAPKGAGAPCYERKFFLILIAVPNSALKYVTVSGVDRLLAPRPAIIMDTPNRH
jgi:hypothetical protein